MKSGWTAYGAVAVAGLLSGELSLTISSLNAAVMPLPVGIVLADLTSTARHEYYQYGDPY